jgi:parvulin-like peptidyl-prolyl isomerase
MSMKRWIAAAALAGWLGTGALQAGLVDAVSIVVDGEPITLYEIYKAEHAKGLDKRKAVEYMIEQKLKEAEIKRLGISVDNYDVNRQIEKIAQQNGIDSLKLRSILASRGVSWQTYKKEMKEKILQERLYKRILSTKIQPPSEETLKAYYQSNLQAFSVPAAIDVVQYTAPTRKALIEAMRNPMSVNPEVTKESKTIRSNEVGGQLLYMLTQTPEGKFTQPIPVDGRYVAFYVEKFHGLKPLPYDEVQPRVYAQWMEQKRKEAIKSHFEKLRAAADIKVLRAP